LGANNYCLPSGFLARERGLGNAFAPMTLRYWNIIHIIKRILLYNILPLKTFIVVFLCHILFIKANGLVTHDIHVIIYHCLSFTRLMPAIHVQPESGGSDVQSIQVISFSLRILWMNTTKGKTSLTLLQSEIIKAEDTVHLHHVKYATPFYLHLLHSFPGRSKLRLVETYRIL